MVNYLFKPFILREVTFKNRIFVSPMCQYSSTEGLPNSWHFVHLGSRAVGGAACVIQEATAILPEGRITSSDCGLWSDQQVDAYRPLVQFIKEQGAIPAIQIAHAGRKASVSRPWEGGKPVTPNDGGWQAQAPSALPFDTGFTTPHALSEGQIKEIIQAFVKATERSFKIGYEVLEIHAAHGYLLHEFLSPLSNQRTDKYGGSLENRMRFTLEVAEAVRNAWPQTQPLFVRLSASDWVEGGWDLGQSLELCRKLKELGVDLIDTSSAGLVPHTQVAVGPGYQTGFAATIRQEVKMPVGAVGLITHAQQAEHVLATGQADVVLLARELLRDPYWPLHAAKELGVNIPWPKQYERARV